MQALHQDHALSATLAAEGPALGIPWTVGKQFMSMSDHEDGPIKKNKRSGKTALCIFFFVGLEYALPFSQGALSQSAAGQLCRLSQIYDSKRSQEIRLQVVAHAATWRSQLRHNLQHHVRLPG